MLLEDSPTSVPNRMSGRTAPVRSLDRGLQLLEFLGAAPEPLSLADLARLAGVDRSTAHRLLGTLLQRGYVTQDARGKRYRLGLKVVELSRQALGDLKLRTVAKGPLKELVRTSGEAANLVVREGDQAVCVDIEPSPAVLAVTNEVGAIFALHATAAGKVLLAHLPEPEMAAWLARHPLPAFAPRSVTDRASLDSYLKQVRRQGYAVDDEESHVGVRCVAAPIRNHQGAVAAALSLSGPAARVTLERLPYFVVLAQKAARGTSTALGCPAGIGL